MVSLDLLVYHDFTDTTEPARVPEVGMEASNYFGETFKDLYVTAVGPGIHEGRITVVLSAENRPDQQQGIKDFFNSWGRSE